MSNRVTRAAISGAAATVLLIGAAAPGLAQPAMPALPDGVGDAISRAAEAAPGVENLILGQRTQIGDHLTQALVYDAKLYKQLMGSQFVVQGEKITVRLEVDGNSGQTHVHGVTDGFKLESVVYNAPDGNAVTLEPSQYHTEERGEVQDTRVDFASNGIGRVRIGNESLSVDFTYVAPEKTGWNQTGGGMEISGAGGFAYRQTKVDTGGPSVNVVARPIAPGLPTDPSGSTGSIDWGSLNIGNSGSAK